MLALTPSSQSPRAYDLGNLQAPALGARLAAGANAQLRADLRAALQDTGYRYKITPAELADGWVDADLTFGFDPGDIRRYGGVDDDSTDNGAVLRDVASLVALSGGGVVRLPFTDTGRYRYTGTLYFYGDDVRFVGDTQSVVLVKTDAGTMVAASPDSHTPGLYTFYSRCGFENIYLESTAATIGLDLTGFSYSTFKAFEVYLPGSNRRCIYGVGHNGSSPYYNSVDDFALFGNNNGSSITGSAGISLEAGNWAGGSNGPNANFFTHLRRAASLDFLVDLRSGNGNHFGFVSGESIHDAYFRMNFRAADGAGTSSGGNSEITFADTSGGWTASEWVGDSVVITGGTGAGQARRIANNTTTVLTLAYTWTVIPDNTSTYQLYRSKCHSNKISHVRGEGLSTSSPDFIRSMPGAKGNRFSNYTVESLGSGLIVNDDQKDPSNSYWDGDLIAIPFVVDGIAAGATVKLTPAIGAAYYQGGFGLDGDFVVESMHVSCEGQSTGSATVTLAVDNYYTLEGVIDADKRWAVYVPGSNVVVGGSGKKLAVSVTTDAGWLPITADLSVLVLVRLLR